MKIIENRSFLFAVSGALVAFSIIIMVVMGLRPGIDFTGGSLLEVEMTQTVETSVVRSHLEKIGYDNVSVQATGEMGHLIRTVSLTEEEHQTVLTSLEETYGELEEMRFDSIGPVIGEELRRTAIWGVLLTLLLIGLYIAWAFRKVSKPVESWKYGVLTIGAAFHDVIITLGLFTILGHMFGWEINSAFVAAALTILGYSINDTVVVFDRTRENLANGVGGKFEDTVELSVKQTLRRSLNTSFTTLLALLAIFLFGGETTRPFAFALMTGIAVGTYSSLFLASPALVAWENWKRNKK